MIVSRFARKFGTMFGIMKRENVFEGKYTAAYFQGSHFGNFQHWNILLLNYVNFLGEEVVNIEEKRNMRIYKELEEDTICSKEIHIMR